MPRVNKIHSLTCKCGAIFDSQEELNEHLASGDCPAQGVVAPRQPEQVAAPTEPGVLTEEEIRQLAVAKALREAQEQLRSEAKALREAAIAKEGIIIPWSMVDPRIRVLPRTRPVLVTVECMQHDMGLEVKSVKLGWK